MKTKSDLVVMPSEGRIFAFFCSERDHKPQNSGCGYTTQSFHTAWFPSRRTLSGATTLGSDVCLGLNVIHNLLRDILRGKPIRLDAYGVPMPRIEGRKQRVSPRADCVCIF